MESYKLKVIFANRKTCFSQRGGDTVQMEKTKEYLEKLYPDIKITYAFSPEDILKDVDASIVHIFNIQNGNETKEYIKAAKHNNKKVVLSPIYWNLLDANFVHYMEFFGIYCFDIPDFLKKFFINICNYFIFFIPQLRNKYKNSVKNGLYNSRIYKKIGKYILKNSDLILPNSIEEADILVKYYDVNIVDKIISVPNAIDINLKNTNACSDSLYLPKNFIMQAGRIEILKNQLGLIKALKDNPEIPIVIVGKKFNDGYCKKVEEYARKRGNVYFLEEISHDKMMQIYEQAKVHVLASYRESPGLVSLEAKLMGCEIVTSNEKYCPIKYYQFDKLGFQCNPYDINSIKEAILNAYNNPKNVELTEEYKNFFSYENVAKMTYEAYLKVLEK